jgi:hypothetical protein
MFRTMQNHTWHCQSLHAHTNADLRLLNKNILNQNDLDRSWYPSSMFVNAVV